MMLVCRKRLMLRRLYNNQYGLNRKSSCRGWRASDVTHSGFSCTRLVAVFPALAALLSLRRLLSSFSSYPPYRLPTPVSSSNASSILDARALYTGVSRIGWVARRAADEAQPYDDRIASKTAESSKDRLIASDTDSPRRLRSETAAWIRGLFWIILVIYN